MVGSMFPVESKNESHRHESTRGPERSRLPDLSPEKQAQRPDLQKLSTPTVWFDFNHCHRARKFF
jgi:hypothetical protein